MKTLLSGLFLLFITAGATAQSTQFGLKFGVNAANFTNDQGSDYKMKTSVNAGMLLHIHLNRYIALQPELVYSGQGTRFATGDNDFRYHLGYINLPFLVQYMTPVGIRLETGPQAGLLVDAAAKTSEHSNNIKSSFKSGDFSWAFGIGYITPANFGFDVRYNLGVSDITVANTSNVRNSVVQAGVFYQFR